MVAFAFPPRTGSSGIQRTLRFVQQLPEHGWEPLVLTAHPRAYPSTSQDLLAEVPPGTVVQRAFALDTARHLAIRGRYLQMLSQPDRWGSWLFGALPTGLRMIRQYRPDVIWSTFPIATAHLVAYQLHRLSGIPWVADFRDPMIGHVLDDDARPSRALQRIERNVVESASRIVFVTPSARALYRARYRSVPSDRFVVIENGYDEESFAAAERALPAARPRVEHFTLLHSGIVYASERDPTALFKALRRMRTDGRVSAGTLRVRFRAPVNSELLLRLAAESQVQDLIEICPPVPYHEALQEMLGADGLLVMQGSSCNQQIPAKLYEYLRARRPVLGLAAPEGDTGKAMLDAGVTHVASLEDTFAIEAALTRYLVEARQALASSTLPRDTHLQSMSRRARTQALAAVLDGLHADATMARAAGPAGSSRTGMPP